MIENASLGVTAVDEKGHLIGYASFFDYPATSPSLSPSAWPDWLHKNFGHPEYGPSNSLFLCFFVADALCPAEVGRHLPTLLVPLP